MTGRALAWTDQAKTGEALRAIRQARDDGLNPADYHLGELQRLPNEVGGGRRSGWTSTFFSPTA